MKARSLCLAALLAASSLAHAATVPEKKALAEPSPSSILFVGNSFFYYNNSMHDHLNRLVRTGDSEYRLRSTSATISGAGLSWHNLEAYFDPAGVGSYSFVEGNQVVFNDPQRKPFDVVILLDCSQCPVHPTLRPVFFDYAAKHAATARRHDAEPVLFMSWAYADQPAMTTGLAEAYVEAGNANDMLVIPAGLAFARSTRDRPDINLYEPDLRHPSLAGTYLGACTVFASFFQKSPEGIAYTAGLDDDTARFLQRTAWETVQEYYGN
ncbi:MAG: hypothetical protein LIP77_04215 [Planctomycetes bacterium]|nr:hypothetical protein [Planctomycetota bacterium]